MSTVSGRVSFITADRTRYIISRMRSIEAPPRSAGAVPLPLNMLSNAAALWTADA
jgi:hypothetical protein